MAASEIINLTSEVYELNRNILMAFNLIVLMAKVKKCIILMLSFVD